MTAPSTPRTPPPTRHRTASDPARPWFLAPRIAHRRGLARARCRGATARSRRLARFAQPSNRNPPRPRDRCPSTGERAGSSTPAGTHLSPQDNRWAAVGMFVAERRPGSTPKKSLLIRKTWQKSCPYSIVSRAVLFSWLVILRSWALPSLDAPKADPLCSVSLTYIRLCMLAVVWLFYVSMRALSIPSL